MTNQELRQKIKHHNLLYYQKDKPEITDAEFDELKRKVIATGKEIDIGAEPDSRFTKVKHLEPMLSLDNIYNSEEVEKFLSRMKKLLNTNKLEVVCELKIDGLSFSAIYENGKFIRAATRGILVKT